MPSVHPSSAVRTAPEAPSQVRIIGGEWRGRKVAFAAVPGLRPTPDRVRETVFNWLQGEVAGRRCLDLFAGSGVLGLEALSRGAGSTVFVESNAQAARNVTAALQKFGCSRGQVVRADALTFLRQPGAGQPREGFDIVFLDPPFADRHLPEVCARLESGGWLRPGAFIYLEDAAAAGEPALPADWQLLKSKRAGEVGYHLARRTTRA